MQRLFEKAVKLEFGRLDIFERDKRKRELLERALTIAQELDDVRFEGGLLRELARHHAFFQRWDVFFDLSEADIDLARASEDAEWEFHSRLSLALTFASWSDLDADQRRVLLEHLDRAIEIAIDASEDEWRLAAAALAARFAAGLPEALDARERFDDAVRHVEMAAGADLETILSWIAIDSAYGDHEEQVGNVRYVHHGTFRQRLRLEPPDEASH